MADDAHPPGQRLATGDDTPPASILNGKYRIERVIGQGSFGRVYLAFDPLLRRNVAIKELLASHRADAVAYDAYLERFQREARAAGSLEHPNIVTVYELAVSADGAYYLVMQYVDGTNLRDLLKQVGTLPIARAVGITVDIAMALAAAHEQNIVHRDVKPANIMLTRRGSAKLADFGIAQVGHESMRTQTAIGHPGTPIYMSPEQAVSAAYLDGRSDLYSLGLVLYEMLAGEPYGRRKQPLATLRGDLPPQLIEIVERLTAREPNARYQSAADLLEDLRELSLLPAMSLTGSAAPLAQEATILPGIGSRPPTNDPLAGVPTAYGGSLSAASSGAPAIPPTTDRGARPGARRGVVIAVAAVVALILVGGITALIVARGNSATPPTANPARVAAQTIPPATGAQTVDLSKWATENTPASHRFYDQTMGEYHIVAVTGGAAHYVTSADAQPISDFIVDADIRHAGGPDVGDAGLVFRVQTRGNGDTTDPRYAFRITPHGEYSLVLVNGDGTFTTLQPTTASSAIKQGAATNHLTVSCKGDTITAAINGTNVGAWKATLVKPGRIGVGLTTSPNFNNVDVAFKNVRIAPL